MVQGPSFSAIAILRDGSASTNQQLVVLKNLKNLIIGQDQRKASAVKNGIVQPLADILAATTKATGKRKLEPNGTPLGQSSSWTTDDELTLQAALVVGSLAAGGASFIRPLCAASIPEILMTALATNVATKLVSAILQAIRTMSTFWSAADETPVSANFWRSIFNNQTLEVFHAILRQPSSSLVGAQQLKLGLEIIANVPDIGSESNEIKELLTNNGVLDTLAALLVSCAIQHKLASTHGELPQNLAPPPQSSLPNILAALSAVIAGSNYRAHRFMLSKSIHGLFWQANSDSRLFGQRHGISSLQDAFLPSLHVPTYRTVSHHQPVSNNFPALRSMLNDRQGASASEAVQVVGDIDHVNAVCSWLLVFARLLRGPNRIIAVRLLALVANAVEAEPVAPAHRTGYVQKTRERERQLTLLAVPLAVELVQSANESRSTTTVGEQQDVQIIRERACTVLALLIKGSKELQVAAVDAGVIKHVCPILKKSFDLISLTKPMWSGKPTAFTDPNAPETCQLGDCGLPPEVLHAMRCRQSALEALASLAAKEDLHRKAIVDAGVVSAIVDSLRPFVPQTISEAINNRIALSPKDGNTTEVILAACRAARSMSRSVSILRTSLIDGGIAKPLIELLHHASMKVQIAATDVCCNLLPDFSPMRDDLSDHNVVKTLTEHARSSTPALRLSSLWALKHLMHSCPKEVKLATLEELGTGWLVGIIQGVPRDFTPLSGAGGVGVGLSTANAAGEQVDLLNPSSMDVDEPPTASEEIVEDEDESGELLYDEASSTHYQASQLRSTLTPPPPSAFDSQRYLSSIREMEQSEEYAAKRDEAAIQQQALDFVRNLINGKDCAVMSDHIMNLIGSAKFYELLTAKLLPLPRTTTGGRQVYNPPELILSTIHVIIHLANASPKHRQMLIAQKPLLQAMLPHFNHVDHRVRVMSVWSVNSLTWIEEDGDRRDAHLRTKELKALGIEQAVRALQDDPNLDVRERVKTAIHQFGAM